MSGVVKGSSWGCRTRAERDAVVECSTRGIAQGESSRWLGWGGVGRVFAEAWEGG